jgi:pimeloyl-ACP methyl ester carboxylesterase
MRLPATAEETVRVFLPDGATMVADLFPGPGDAILLLLPGFWRSRLSVRLRDLGRRLGAVSSVAVVDLRGHGESTGRYTFGATEPADVGFLLRDLQSRGYRRFGILGFSMGGYIGMEAMRHSREINLCGAALVSSPTAVQRARPLFISIHVYRQIQRREVLRRVPRFTLREAFRRRQDAAMRPAGETFPVDIFHCRRDWLIPDTEPRAWATGLGARARVTVLENPGRLHADAMLGGSVQLEDRLEAWWRGLAGAR